MALLRTVRADRFGAPEETWRCGDCGDAVAVADGWVVDTDDPGGPGTRRFLCGGCTDRERDRLAASDAPGGITCHRCRQRCPSGEGAVVGHLDEVTGEVFHVPLCLPCADRELADI
jgi:hypothetical protein